MPDLVLGPLHRFVGETEATVWVETSGPCEVEVLRVEADVVRVRPAVRDRIRATRDTSLPPGLAVQDFEGYTWVYRESWGDPVIRWLLSTVPSAMVWDDHDMHDD